MPTLLAYSLSTNPLPLQASPSADAPTVATLMLLATNLTKASVPLKGISVRLPVGSGAAELTASPLLIGAVPPAGWTLHSTQTPLGAVVYVFYPPAGEPTLAAGAALAFIFNNVQPNTAVGIVPVLVSEGSTGNPGQTIELPKFPARWGQVSFWATPPTVAAGSGPQLAWAGPAGATYGLQYYDIATNTVVSLPAPGRPALKNEGAYPNADDKPLTLRQSTNFTLTVSAVVEGRLMVAQQQVLVTVMVPPPRFRRFEVSPAHINLDYPMRRLVVNWETENVAVLTIPGIGNFVGEQAAHGSCEVFPKASQRYLATAFGLAGGAWPPATAEARVGFVKTYWTALDLNSNSSTPVPVTIEGVGTIFHIIRTDSGEEIEYSLRLQPGFELTDLPEDTTEYRDSLSFAQVLQGPYSRDSPKGTLLRVDDFHVVKYVRRGWNWGVRLPNSTYGILWTWAVRIDGQKGNAYIISPSFSWMSLAKAFTTPAPDLSETAS